MDGQMDVWMEACMDLCACACMHANTTLHNNIHSKSLDMYSRARGRIQDWVRKDSKNAAVDPRDRRQQLFFFQAMPRLLASASLVGGSNLVFSKRFDGPTAAPPSLSP